MTDQFLGLHPKSMLDSGVSSFNGSSKVHVGRFVCVEHPVVETWHDLVPFHQVVEDVFAVCQMTVVHGPLKILRLFHDKGQGSLIKRKSMLVSCDTHTFKTHSCFL